MSLDLAFRAWVLYLQVVYLGVVSASGLLGCCICKWSTWVLYLQVVYLGVVSARVLYVQGCCICKGVVSASRPLSRSSVGRLYSTSFRCRV